MAHWPSDGTPDPSYGMPVLASIQQLLPLPTVRYRAVMAKPSFLHDVPGKARLTRV